jgi:hypothetical protein
VAHDGDRVEGVRISRAGGRLVDVEAAFVLDATETGDLLPLAGVEYVTGAESQAETGEPHALSGPAEPQSMQSFTVAFALEHREGEDHVIDRPEQYDRWRDYRPDFWPGPLLDFQQLDPMTMRPLTGACSTRACTRASSTPPSAARTATATCCGATAASSTSATSHGDARREHGDLAPERLLARLHRRRPDETRDRHVAEAKQLSLSLLYWLQTEAPRPDGGAGYPGLRLRDDVFGTADGLAVEPYVREGRRIRARVTVKEQDLAFDVRGEHGAVRYPDSVGIGMYRIDLHPCTGGRSYVDLTTCPFQIPLGALVPQSRREPAPGLQEHRHHPHHQRRLPAPPDRVERGRGGGAARRPLPAPRPHPAGAARRRGRTRGVPRRPRAPRDRTRVAAHRGLLTHAAARSGRRRGPGRRAARHRRIEVGLR